MRLGLGIVLMLVCCSAIMGEVEEIVLVPRPVKVEVLEGRYLQGEGRFIAIECEKTAGVVRSAEIIQDSLGRMGAGCSLHGAVGTDGGRNAVVISMDGELGGEAYVLEVTGERINVSAGDEAGVFYAAQTLRQLCVQFESRGYLPCLRIEDRPAFEHRGLMLDISRNKVPKLETLFRLVDLLSEWKVNQFQLYTEHTFAYRGHEVVWEGASPVTAEDVLRLDRYCRERYVELVPNQNSFGHMERWLRHEAYKKYAEAPEGCETDYGWRAACDLNPVDGNCVEFVAGLYDELLPNFSSGYFNVGCDETISLGRGRSKAACEELGKGTVYGDYVGKINELVKGRGKRMMMWGDIVLEEPEAISRLPEDVILLNWGYYDTQPTEESCRVFAESGHVFYVCPGTANWLTVVGNWGQATANMDNAAARGKKYGAVGYLNTEWGDGGHMQSWPVSMAGMMYGAGAGWSVEGMDNGYLGRALDRFVYGDEAGVVGEVVIELGLSCGLTKWTIPNWNPYFYIIANREFKFDSDAQAAERGENFRVTLARIEEIARKLDGEKMTHAERGQMVRELRNSMDIVRHSLKLGMARLEAEGYLVENIAAERRAGLAEELEGILAEYKELWLMRNREGGLAESAGRFERLLKLYRGEATVSAE